MQATQRTSTSTRGSTPMERVEELIKERIGVAWRITFAEFMELVLYHPELGYYSQAKERIGAAGDFYTSPASHPLFGALIALQLEQMWQLLGSPSSFTVVEVGAGKGLLAKAVIDYLPNLIPAFAGSINYVAIERNKAQTLHPPQPSRAAPASGLVPESSLPDRVTGCFLSNELPDALPVHRVTMREGRLWEIYVALQNNSFREFLDEPSSPLLEQQLTSEGITLAEGQTAEVNLEAAQWMENVAQRLDRGFVLTIDYGFLAQEQYSEKRRQGTLMAYYRHTTGDNPYTCLGEQDITSHVDFTSLILAGERKGLRVDGCTTQRQFLQNLGLKAFLQALALKGLSQYDYTANRFAILELIKPGEFGDFKVLVQSKGLGPLNLYGLTANNEMGKRLLANRSDLAVPILGAEHIPLLAGKYPHLAFAPDIPMPDADS